MIKKLLTALLVILTLTNCGDTSQEFKPNYVAGPLQSCSVEQVIGGAIMSCPDGSEVFIANGADGVDGLDGLFVGYVDPCGSETAHDELLYLDRDGNYHAWMKDVGHVILQEGVTYVVTDGTNCRFKLQGDQIIDNL